MQFCRVLKKTRTIAVEIYLMIEMCIYDGKMGNSVRTALYLVRIVLSSSCWTIFVRWRRIGGRKLHPGLALIFGECNLCTVAQKSIVVEIYWMIEMRIHGGKMRNSVRTALYLVRIVLSSSCWTIFVRWRRIGGRKLHPGLALIFGEWFTLLLDFLRF